MIINFFYILSTEIMNKEMNPFWFSNIIRMKSFHSKVINALFFFKILFRDKRDSFAICG